MRQLNRMKRSLAIAAALLWIAPLAVRAEAPATTQPTVNPADAITPSIEPPDVSVSPAPSGQAGAPTPGPGGASSGGQGGGDNHRQGGHGPRSLQPLTDKEIADAMQFMSQHSKNRYDAIQSLPDGEKKTEIKNFTARAYMTWMRMANEDSKLYPVVVKRVELEDEIFGKVTLLKKETDADKQKVLNDELKVDVGKLLDIGLQERKLRLDQLAEIVKKEQKQLDEDSANRAALVDERLKAIIKSSDSSSLVPSGGGGGGGQGPHGRGSGRP